MLSIALLGSLARATPRVLSWLLAGALVFVLLVLGALPARADESRRRSTRRFSTAFARSPSATPRPRARCASRSTLGQLDPRLHLAPCQRIEPYLPVGVRLWGKARIGLRCKEGSIPWNVYLPITVKVYGRAVVVPAGAEAGSILAAADLSEAEVDLADEFSPAIVDAKAAEGRVARPADQAGPDAAPGAAQGAPVVRRRRHRQGRRFGRGLRARGRRPGAQRRRRRPAGQGAHRERPGAHRHRRPASGGSRWRCEAACRGADRAEKKP